MKSALGIETVSSTELYSMHKTYAEQVESQQETMRGHKRAEFRIMSEMMGMMLSHGVARSKSEAAALPENLRSLTKDLNDERQEIGFNGDLNAIAKANYDQNLVDAQDNIDAIMGEAIAENVARNHQEATH